MKYMLIFLYGEDAFRSRRKLRELKEKFYREVNKDGEGMVVIDGLSAKLGDIHGALSTASFFSRKKMVIVENILANKDKKFSSELLAYLQARKEDNSDNILIFWDEISEEKSSKNKLFTYLSAQKYVQSFPLLSNTATAAWIRSEVEARGGKIKPQAAVMLGGYFSGDSWRLDTEIDKLIGYRKGLASKTGTESIIDTSDIQEMCQGNADENIFAMTDAISNKNKRQLLELLEKEIGTGVNEGYILHMILRQFKNLIQVKDALDRGFSIRKIESAFKLHPYVVKKTVGQVQGFGKQSLAYAYDKLLSIDESMKTGKGDLRADLERLFVGM